MNPVLEELKKLHQYYKTGRFSKLGIAIALGVDRRTVRRWFQAKHPPTEKHQKMIENLVKELQQNVDDLAPKASKKIVSKSSKNQPENSSSDSLQK